MRANEGVIDRLIRVLLACLSGGFAWFAWPDATSLVLLVVAAVLFVTAAVGWCGAYSVLHISTNKGARA
jgi:hypothetical protein